MNVDFLGSYDKTLYRDEKTGFTIFTINSKAEDIPRTKFGSIKCLGIIPAYPRNVPLYITGIIAKDQQSIRIRSCEVCGRDVATTIAFLADKQFDGIGEKTAEEIVKRANGDVFKYCRENELAKEDFAEIKGLTLQAATSFVSKIKKYSELQELVSYIATIGGTCEDAEAIYKEYGNESMERIRRNPYVLFKADIPFVLREAIAKRNGIRTLNRKRVLALIYECFDRAAQNGHTCLTIKMLAEAADFIEKQANMGYHTNKLYLFSVIIEEKKNFVIQYDEDGTVRIYRTSMFEKESRAARHIIRLVKGARPFPTENVTVEEIEKDCGITYEEHQRDAFKLMSSGGVKILTGGPGTGKSTVIKGLLAYYRKMFPEASVALCAPTGAASKRMREVTGEHAQTIHKLLDVKPFGNSMQYRDEYNQLPYDLIIADEFSMVDTELFMMLVSGIKTGALLLIVGDEEQLASVGAGNVLHDLMDDKNIEVCRLTKVFRQSGNSAILENSIKIREGKSDLIEDATFEVHCVDTEEQMRDIAIDIMKKNYKADNISHIKLYSPVKQKKYLPSTLNLNVEMHNILNSKSIDESLVYGGMTFSKGDPIIMGRNNYKLHYMNGDEGFVYNVRKSASGKACLELCIDNELITIMGKDLADVSLAYALTIHKAQGSECEIAVVLIPENPANMLERSMVYVAETRAKKKDILIIQGQALKRAVQTDRRQLRETGLNRQIAAFAKIANNEK